MRKKAWILCGCGILLALSTLVLAEGPVREVELHAVDQETPDYVRTEANQNGVRQELNLIKIVNNPEIEKPPVVEAKILYYAKVKMGKPAMDYGLLLDFEGEKKLVWMDADGDKDYAEETPYEIFKSDRYPGINVYFSPTPLSLRMNYRFSDHDYQATVMFDLPYLVVARIGNSDFFYLKTRTWFSGQFHDDDEEVSIALVDANDNGSFNDPDDMIYVDRDYDLKYSAKEGTPVKKLKSMKLKSKKKVTIDYGLCPEKLLLQ